MIAIFLMVHHCTNLLYKLSLKISSRMYRLPLLPYASLILDMAIEPNRIEGKNCKNVLMETKICISRILSSVFIYIWLQIILGKFRKNFGIFWKIIFEDFQNFFGKYFWKFFKNFFEKIFKSYILENNFIHLKNYFRKLSEILL